MIESFHLTISGINHPLLHVIYSVKIKEFVMTNDKIDSEKKGKQSHSRLSHR
jgi:hypothetical protein